MEVIKLTADGKVSVKMSASQAHSLSEFLVVVLTASKEHSASYRMLNSEKVTFLAHSGHVENVYSRYFKTLQLVYKPQIAITLTKAESAVLWYLFSELPAKSRKMEMNELREIFMNIHQKLS